jgi:hypothetical protein
MFNMLRNRQMTAAAILVVASTMTGTGVASADDQVSLEFENTLDQDIVLDVNDNYYYDPGVRHISLNRGIIDGKPSKVGGNRVGFKTSKNKEGRILLKVTVHCGSSTDAFFYTQPPSGNIIKISTGCKLTRS